MNFHIVTICILFLTSCNASQNAIQRKEAIEDQREFDRAMKMQRKVPFQIIVDGETEPVNSKLGEDAADDPAIFHNEKDPKSSIIIGTNKRAGLMCYNLLGEEISFHQTGKVNNVDLLSNFKLNNEIIQLVGATNRSNQTISFLKLDKNSGELSLIYDQPLQSIDEAYGFTMYQHNGQAFAIANGKNGVIELYELISHNNGLNTRYIGKLKVPSQPEGMVVDTLNNIVYVGVEEEAIYGFSLKNLEAKPVIIQSSNREQNQFIEYDIEGVTLFYHHNKTYLLASIQGNFSYALFDISQAPEATSYITSFSLISNHKKQVDGAEETDGLEVSTSYISEEYPEGILVVQDGFNTDENGQSLNQNFKLVDFRKILNLLSPKTESIK